MSKTNNYSFHVGGNVEKSQLQYSTVNSTQELNVAFDYDTALTLLTELQMLLSKENEKATKSSISSDMAELVTEIVTQIQQQEDPSKIKRNLTDLVEFLKGIGSSLAATALTTLL